jgi:hypothetical protein
LRVKATNEKQPHAVCARPALVESRRADEPAASLAVDAPFAMALIVYLFVAGLIQANLLTRIFLFWRFLCKSELLKRMARKVRNKVDLQTLDRRPLI